MIKVNNLTGKRTAVGITKKEMANLLGISQQAYSKKENGVNPFKDFEMLKIYNHLKMYYSDITIDHLFFNL